MLRAILLTLLTFGLTATSFGQEWKFLVEGDDLSGWEQLGGEATYTASNGEVIGTTVANTRIRF